MSNFYNPDIGCQDRCGIFEIMKTIDQILSEGGNYGLTKNRVTKLRRNKNYYKDENVLSAVTFMLIDNFTQREYMPENRYAHLRKAGTDNWDKFMELLGERPTGLYYCLLEQKLPNRYSLSRFNRKQWRDFSRGEGETQTDAIIFSKPDQFSDGLLCIAEAKLLSESGKGIARDRFRDQISRNVEMGIYLTRGRGSEQFNSFRFKFILITPVFFKKTRLMQYREEFEKVKQGEINLRYAWPNEIKNRIREEVKEMVHWITWEDIYNTVLRGVEKSGEIEAFFRARCLVDG